MNKEFLLTALLVFSISTFISSCKKSETNFEPSSVIKGKPGNPRFNLQFSNAHNVDLDLHVLTPNGTEISYRNPSGDGGFLDVDCLCGSCPDGASENIFWIEGTAPRGIYKFWIEYYTSCTLSDNTNSSYTLRVMRNHQVLETFTGTVNSETYISPVYTFNFN